MRKQKLNIVICSTLQPGTFQKSLKNLMSKFNLNFIYCPEFVALGNTINGFTKPDILLIGGENKKLILDVKKIHKIFSKPNNISTMSFQGAEIVKLAVNSYVCTKISYANLISQICNKRNINESSKIVDTIGFDSRIGNKFFKSGPPFGGLCFPKDVEAFYNLCMSSKVNSQMIKSIQTINFDQKKLFIRKLRNFIAKYKIEKLGVIGLSFKEDTMTINESQYLEVLKKFKKIKYQIYDLSPDIENFINSTHIKSINKIIKENKYLLVNHTNKKFITKIDNSSPKIIFSPWFIDFNKKHKFHSL